jgi:hypothetical protein
MSGDEFLKKLRSDDVSVPVLLTGLAKKPEDDGEFILFTPGATCGRWIRLPVRLIEKVEVMRVISCGDHQHPFIRLQIRKPETDEGMLLASLLERCQQYDLLGGTPVLALRKPPDNPLPPCHFDFELWCDEEGNCEWREVFHCPDEGSPGFGGGGNKRRFNFKLAP